MPCGAYEKDEIRKIAEDIELKVAKKPDSQDICFVPDNDYAGFIEQTSGKKFAEGNFVVSLNAGFINTSSMPDVVGLADDIKCRRIS